MSSLTLVTALFDLASRDGTNRRSAEEYMKHGQFVLNLDQNLVLFVDPAWFWPVWRCRRDRGLLDKTAIVSMPLEQSPYHARLDDIERARVIHPVKNANPSKDTARYILLTWTKMHLLHRVAVEDPFQTSHFGWIDFGLAHVADLRYHADATRVEHLEDRIKVLMLKPFSAVDVRSPSYFDFVRGHLAAGYLTGARSTVEGFCQIFEREVDALLDQKYAPSEEQIFPRLVVEHPDLFAFYYGDYDGILNNYWRQRSSVPISLYALRTAIQECQFLVATCRLTVFTVEGLGARCADRREDLCGLEGGTAVDDARSDLDPVGRLLPDLLPSRGRGRCAPVGRGF